MEKIEPVDQEVVTKKKSPWERWKESKKEETEPVQPEIQPTIPKSERPAPPKEEDLFLKNILAVETKNLRAIQDEKDKRDEAQNRAKIQALEQQIEYVQPPEVHVNQDAYIETLISKDEVKAWCVLIPPVGEGAVLNKDAIMLKLMQSSITSGLHEERIDDLAQNPTYRELVLIAEGVLPIDGVDGSVHELFLRDRKIHLEVIDGGDVDFKKLNWFQQAKQGEKICDLILPIPPVDGLSVKGIVLKGKSPAMPRIPAGRNTKVNEENTAVVALCDGQVSFEYDVFQVDQILHITGNIDNSSGNIDVIGNVTIDGMVMSGFSVKATGDIIVKGLVEEAQLSAGGNIHVSLGVKGGLKGSLVAKGEVKSKFLENCQVRARGPVLAESIINSNVSSSDRVLAVSGRGIIIGGRICALKSIEAKVIGNENNRTTELFVGMDPSQVDIIHQLKIDVAKLSTAIEETERNSAYLSEKVPFDAAQAKLFAQLKLKLTVDKMSYSQKSKQLEFLTSQQDESDCQILANKAFPSTVIEIGANKRILRQVESMCRFYKKDGEIERGTK